MILFGSLAGGVPTPASDADLVVVLREAEPRRMDRIPELLRILARAPLPLDLHPVTVEEWAEAVRRDDAFARRVEAEGIDLLD